MEYRGLNWICDFNTNDKYKAVDNNMVSFYISLDAKSADFDMIKQFTYEDLYRIQEWIDINNPELCMVGKLYDGTLVTTYGITLAECAINEKNAYFSKIFIQGGNNNLKLLLTYLLFSEEYISDLNVDIYKQFGEDVLYDLTDLALNTEDDFLIKKYNSNIYKFMEENKCLRKVQ